MLHISGQSGRRFGLSSSLPGQAALDFQIERKAQEGSDKDNAPKDANALNCRGGGDGTQPRSGPAPNPPQGRGDGHDDFGVGPPALSAA